ncbi:winged helix-turn-helix domain-containing protein [Actinocorallia longicatena]|uniref:HTH marR-type domain-containing protein n=1 Tax=Actinocorallia longicatena TaxID=111803 RepID=A0ABP6QH46_9ACTN
MPTVRERILEELRTSSRPLDDDELARRLGISPRQSVNQACRRLEAAGLVRRFTGPDLKIVNELVRGGSGAAPVDPEEIVAVEAAARAPGDGAEQRRAEGLMLRLLGGALGVGLAPRRFVLGGGARAEVDGVDEGVTVLVEAWAHQGPPKTGQKHKVLADALKLLYLSSNLGTSPRLILCLGDPEAAAAFTGTRTWAALALRDLGVEVHTVVLPDDVRAALRAAQRRMYR